MLGAAESLQDAQVVAAEGTGTDDGDTDGGGHDYFVLTGASTALRQRA